MYGIHYLCYNYQLIDMKIKMKNMVKVMTILKIKPVLNPRDATSFIQHKQLPDRAPENFSTY